MFTFSPLQMFCCCCCVLCVVCTVRECVWAYCNRFLYPFDQIGIGVNAQFCGQTRKRTPSTASLKIFDMMWYDMCAAYVLFTLLQCCCENEMQTNSWLYRLLSLCLSVSALQYYMQLPLVAASRWRQVHHSYIDFNKYFRFFAYSPANLNTLPSHCGLCKHNAHCAAASANIYAFAPVGFLNKNHYYIILCCSVSRSLACAFSLHVSLARISLEQNIVFICWRCLVSNCYVTLISIIY